MTDKKPYYRKRNSKSFPPTFHKLLLHVARTGKHIDIDNLGDERKYYTSFRARVNEYRSAFRNEAIAEGDEHKIRISDEMYCVTLQNPQKNSHGQWFCRIKLYDDRFSEAIAEKLGDEAGPVLETDLNARPAGEQYQKPNLRESSESEGMKAISDLLGGDED